MKRLAAGCLMAVLLMTGCNESETPQVQSMQQENNRPSMGQITYGLLGPGPANYGGIKKFPSHAERGQENTTGTSYRTMNQNRQSLGDDQVKIGNIVRESPFTPGMVIIAGSHAWINLKVPTEMDDKEKKKNIQLLRQQLTKQIPRYQVHLNEDENS